MRTALVLINLINDIIHPDGAMPTCAAEVERRGVLVAANQALELARARGWSTILVKVGFRAGYQELPAHAPILAGPGSWGPCAWASGARSPTPIWRWIPAIRCG
jgi:nicotinamidase-related amidase